MPPNNNFYTKPTLATKSQKTENKWHANHFLRQNLGGFRNFVDNGGGEVSPSLDKSDHGGEGG